MTVLDWADELDAIAATMPARTPIRVDPALAAALAEPGALDAPLPLCTDCVRPIRPRRTHLADWPGTVALGAGQRCSGCYDRHRTGGPRRHPTVPVNTPCTGCHRPMRPHRMRLADAPHTVLHHRAGLCFTCAKET